MLGTYYRRHLPHFLPDDSSYHVVFRLTGSLPRMVVKELKFEREQAERLLKRTKNELDRKNLIRQYRWDYFKRFDALLDGDSTGPHWLKNSEIAEIVREAIHYRDGKQYDLLAYCIMPNHVHMVFTVGRAVCPTYMSRKYCESLNGIQQLNLIKICIGQVRSGRMKAMTML